MMHVMVVDRDRFWVVQVAAKIPLHRTYYLVMEVEAGCCCQSLYILHFPSARMIQAAYG